MPGSTIHDTAEPRTNLTKHLAVSMARRIIEKNNYEASFFGLKRFGWPSAPLAVGFEKIVHH